jgi:hypothetical protein
VSAQSFHHVHHHGMSTLLLDVRQSLSLAMRRCQNSTSSSQPNRHQGRNVCYLLSSLALHTVYNDLCRNDSAT